MDPAWAVHSVPSVCIYLHELLKIVAVTYRRHVSHVFYFLKTKILRIAADGYLPQQLWLGRCHPIPGRAGPIRASTTTPSAVRSHPGRPSTGTAHSSIDDGRQPDSSIRMPSPTPFPREKSSSASSSHFCRCRVVRNGFTVSLTWRQQRERERGMPLALASNYQSNRAGRRQQRGSGRQATDPGRGRQATEPLHSAFPCGRAAQDGKMARPAPPGICQSLPSGCMRT